ncbi:phage tail protein [Exiguobacterium sp. s133]|uniref:phage tail protein n=1 Tax=Exiguobacterium sp. s133 TaxID=2751213 RepID=UPI001BE94BD6|nr:phage tail protein [Exiguobacterium sp. s133]
MYFDAQPPIERPVLHLARPDRKVIARLSEVQDETENFNLGQLTELTFSVPLKYETLEENKVNLNAQKLLERMLIRLSTEGEERWYIISSRNIDVDSKKAMITAKSTAYTLSDIPIKSFSTVENTNPDGLDYSSWTLSEIIRETVDRDEDTMWALGNVDIEFELKRREFTHDGSLGELVVAAAEKFGAIPVYDDLNSKIHFKHPDKVGRNRGLKLTYDNYLLSMSKDSSSDSLATQLTLYGSEGLTIREINPTGSTYIEDFSYFLYPYQEDTNGNVIKSSMFMSDSLAGSIVKYAKKIEDLTPSFQTILLQLETYMKQISDIETEKSIEDTELVKKQEQIDIWLGTNNGVSNPTYEAEKQVIVDKIAQFQEQIDSLVALLSDLAGDSYYDTGYVELGASGGQLGLLKEQLLIRNNFTPEQIKERSYYIIRKEWSNDSITEAKDLLEEGRKAFKEFSRPSLNMNVSVVDFLSSLETPFAHKQLYLGDTVRTEDDWEHRVLEGKILGITRNYYEKSLDLQIANFSSEEDSADKFLKMIYQASFASTVVNESKYKWDLSVENNGTINALINQNFDAVGKKVTGGAAGLTEFSARGLTSRDYENRNEYLVIQNGRMAITKDEGVSWSVAITPQGIVGERVFGKIIAGVNLTIEDEDGIVRMLGNKISISNRSDEEVMKIGLLSNSGDADRFGLVVDNRRNQVGIVDNEGFYIAKYVGENIEKLLWTDTDGNLNTQKITATDMKIVNADFKSGVVKNANGENIIQFGTFGMKLDNASFEITNGGFGVRMNKTEGFVNENNDYIISMNPSSGFKMRNKITATDVFYINTEGKLTLKNVVIDGGAINWNNTNKMAVNWDDVSGKPNVPNGTYIDQYGLYTGTIAANRISAGTISGLSFNTYVSTTTGWITLDGGEMRSYKYGSGSAEFASISNGFIGVTVYTPTTGTNQTVGLDGNYGFYAQSTMDTTSRLRMDVIESESAWGRMVYRIAAIGTNPRLDIQSDYKMYFYAYNEMKFTSPNGITFMDGLGIGGAFNNTPGTSNVSIGSSNIYAPGKVYASGVALTSSVTRKTNIEVYNEDAIDFVKSVNIYTYHYQSDVDEFNFENKQIGVLAEAVPMLLRGGESDSINVYALTSMLWKAVQQQQLEIESLQKEISDLQDAI